MILNKKRFFLYTSIILLILVVGVYFVNSIGVVSRNQLSTQVNATTEANTSVNAGTGPGADFPDVVNWTLGGQTELFVFKINISGLGATDNNNVTRINITLPNGFSSPVRQAHVAALANASFQQTIGGVTGSNVSWTINTTDTYISVFNETAGTLGSITGIPLVMGPASFSETIFIYFNATAENGTERVVNWTVAVYNSTAGRQGLTGGNAVVIDDGLGLLTGIDGLPPRKNVTNVTDGTNTISSFSGTQYLLYDTTNAIKGVNITLSLTDYNIDRVLLVFNSTGGSLNLATIRDLRYNASFLSGNLTSISIAPERRNFTILEQSKDDGGKSNFTSLDSRSALNPTATEYIFLFNISNTTWGTGAGDSTTFNYVFVVYDLYNNSEIINNSDAEFVIARDVDRPKATITEPADKTIEVTHSIKYTCDCSDTASGVKSCTTKLTKPGGTTIEKTGDNTEHTFTLTDTDEAGEYKVDCTAKDNTGRTASASQKSFNVYYSTGGVAAPAAGVGGGGGGSREEAIIVPKDVTGDLGTLTTAEVYTSIAKDGKVTFTVAGASHTVTVLEVTADGATLEVSSTPSQFTLNIGESQEVDVNDDGTNDLLVTLSSITDDNADLSFKSLAPVEEVPEEVPEEVITGEEVRPSLTFLWIVLIVVVVILLIWYFSRRKR